MTGRDGNPGVVSFALADVLLLLAGVMSGPAVEDAAAFACSDDELDALLHAAGADRDSATARAFRRLIAEIRIADRTAWQHECTRLFNGPIVCPANETAYVRRDKGVLIGDICGFYRAFGFEPDGSHGEKADHLACELEFLGALLVMRGQAERRGNAENAAVAADAAVGFLADHLGDWLGLFCRRLEATSDHPVHQRSVEALRALWDLLSLHFPLPGLDATDIEIDERAWEDEGTPYECDLADTDSPDRRVTLTGPPGSGLPRA